MCHRLRWCLRLLGFGLMSMVTGCQTWHFETGMTLPSPHYLEHPPQFIQPSPPFPLPKELFSLEKATAASVTGPGVPGIP